VRRCSSIAWPTSCAVTRKLASIIYTESTGAAVFNDGLPQSRAQAVAGARESNDIAIDRIQAIGRGENFPVASNSTPAGRQQNRRVDIVLSDMAGRFAQAANEGPGAR